MSAMLLERFRKSRRAQVIFCIGGLAFAALFLLWQLGGSLDSLIPSEERLAGAEKELKKVSAAAAEMDARVAEAEALEKAYRERLSDIWVESRDGNPDIEMRRKIEAAATTSGLKLNSIGSVRRSRVNGELSLIEIDMSSVATLDLLTAFIAETGNVRPLLYWKKADFRPEQMNSTSERVVFSGTVRCLWSAELPDGAPAAAKNAAPAKKGDGK